MLPNKEVLSQVLEALYEAPLDPSRWEEFLKLTAAAVGAEAAALLLHDFADAPPLVARQWSIPPETTRHCGEYHAGLNIWRQAVTKASDWLGTSKQVVSFAELQGTEFYDDLLAPFGMPNGIFAMVERGPSRVANLSLYRSREAGPFQERDLDVVRFLCPHIQRAYRLRSYLAGSRKQRASLQAALDSLAMGVILLASRGQVVTMNHAAERLLADDDCLQATGEGLRARDPDESARLGQLVHEATTASEEQELRPAGLLTISRANAPALLLSVSPIRDFELNEAHPVRAVVFVSDPAQRVRPTHATLRALFGLTPAEYRLAMLLADGQKPAAIAEMVGVSRNTLKSQLSGIYRKRGTSRQAQLVRLLLQLPTTSPVKGSTAIDVILKQVKAEGAKLN